jgi:transcription antitermination factor NusG
VYRLDENPLSRYPEGRSLSEDTGKWKVAFLKSRREKHFALELMGRSLGYYLPLFIKRARRKDNGKERKSLLPLFPGYLALVCEPDTLRKLQGVGDLVSIIDIVDQVKFVRELDQVKTLLDRNVALRPQKGIAAGAKVKVLSGALKGLEGVVVRDENESRFIVGIEMFAQSVSVKIEEADLSRLEGA